MPNDQSTQTLLANARQSTKDELAVRRKTQRERLQAFWDDCFELLQSFARECIADSYESDGKVSDCETALQNVAKKLRRCKAQTREGFLSWAVRMLAKEKGFHLAARAIRDFDLDISNWIADAETRLTRYADFPEHYKDGDLYRLKMGESDGVPIMWTVPEQYWEFVRRLWPVTLKAQVNGYFIAKQIAGQTIPAHRLILNCTPGDTVQSTSGNFLDWSSLYVRPFNRSGIYEGRNTSWNKEADRSRTAQEEFEHRFQSRKALENYGTNLDCTERFSIPRPVPINADRGTAGCFGKVEHVGWVKPITPAERDLEDATERYLPRVSKSVRMQAAAKALTQLGL
jgi:hypothetical protein